ncbi:MAG: transglycosylase SLT domain-containing protein [Lactobacillus sp.]|jgi:hypothetical protein|nr:transglycosylase SLT domain-containing protein [Lactobacillus sp.]
MRNSVSKILMFFLLMLMLSQPVQARTSDMIVDDRLVCMIETQKQEKNYQIKEHLLTTIAAVESGRWDKRRQQNMAWPWTINAQGKGMYFETKAEAVKEVKRLQEKGVKSIDVGCMQINLSYHGDAFDSIEDAFDPEKNVEYGAKFLKKLYNSKKDWTKAAMAYHSGLARKANIYKKKIELAFETTKKLQNDLNNEFVVAKKNSDKIKIAKVTEKSMQKNAANAWREAKLTEYRTRKLAQK